MPNNRFVELKTFQETSQMTRVVQCRKPIARLTLCLGGCLVATIAGTAQSTNSPQTARSSTWTVQYTVSGGIAGRVEHISVRQDGVTQTWGLRAAKRESTISPEELAKIRSLVKACKLSDTAKPAESQIPDMISSELTIEIGGHLYYIGPEGKDLAQELHRLFEQKAQEAENAKWAKAGPFRLGRVWKVKEEIRDQKGRFNGEFWLGTWTRRADTNLFDALWRNSRTGEEVKGVVQLDSAERGMVTLHRLGTKQIYHGVYQPEHMNTVSSGSISAPGSTPCLWWAAVEK
jgi:hypothetical protein